MSPSINQSRKPASSLDAAAADGDGGGVNVSGYTDIAMQVTHTGSPTGGTVTLELSLDGSTWHTTSAVFDISADASGDMFWSVDSPAAYARATLASLAGGTSPTVTALISGA